MEISRKTDYALRTLAYLASQPNKVLSVRMASEKNAIPYSFARSIQHELVKAGMIESVRGAAGGMRLIVDPKEVTLLQIVETMQGPVRIATCDTAGCENGVCERMETCGFNPIWRGACKMLNEYFSSVTLHDIITGEKAPTLTSNFNDPESFKPFVKEASEKLSMQNYREALLTNSTMANSSEFNEFRQLVLRKGRELYRDLEWRNTTDPYAVWVSEVMLQQTQVCRVEGRWQRWLQRFPDYQSLAAADTVDVLDEWQGMGYNRRALSLQKAAQILVQRDLGFPSEIEDLITLPGIGPATAAGIRSFAFNKHAMYLETNVRAVFLHELFPGAQKVPDKVLAPLVDQGCPSSYPLEKSIFGPEGIECDCPRTWYYALLDYGAYLKKIVPNPSRRSSTHTKQSKFEGSHRQKRACTLRIFLDATQSGMAAMTREEVRDILSEMEVAEGRKPVAFSEVDKVLSELCCEGFLKEEEGFFKMQPFEVLSQKVRNS